MSGNKMTQEDIDKLLSGNNVPGAEQLKKSSENNIEETAKNPAAEEQKSQIEILKEEKEKMKSKQLNQEEKDVIGEIANISFGSAATSLSAILNRQVSITTPMIEIIQSGDINEDEAPFVVLSVNYTKGLEIDNFLVIKKEVAIAIADIMMGGSGQIDETKQLGEMELSAVQEAMNQMMGASATAMSEIFAKMVDISPPSIKVVEKDDKNQLNIVEGTSVSISFDLEIGGTIKSKLKQVISFENAKKMANELMNDVKGESIQIQNELTIDEEELLTQTEKDVIGELANISFGAAATSLSTILSHKVSITTPNIEIVEASEIEDGELPHVVLHVDYIKGLNMQNLLVIEKPVAIAIADIMMGGKGQVAEGKELDEMELSAVQEAMNQMMGSSATAMSEVFGRMVDISPPSIRLNELNSELKSVSTDNGKGKFVKISFNLDIGGIIKSKLIQALSIVEAKELAKQLIGIMNPSQENEVDINGLLSKEERDVIGEIANISFGAASTSLSTLLRHKVRITAPSIEVIDKNKVEGRGIPQVVLAVNFTKGLLMENILVIDKHVANVIADLMMGGTGEVTEKELSEMELSAVQEAMNQMMGSAATAMSEVFDEVVDISPPVLKLSELQKEIEQITTNEEKDEFVNISFDLDIGGFLKSKLVQAMSIEKAKEMSNKLLKNIAEESDVETYNVVLEEFSPSKVKVKETKVKPILKEVKVKVEVIFGNTVKPLKEILTLEEDDIVALLEEVDEPLKIYANGIFIAEGEIVNVDGYFGVEIKNVHVK